MLPAIGLDPRLQTSDPKFGKKSCIILIPSYTLEFHKTSKLIIKRNKIFATFDDWNMIVKGRSLI